jgi:F-type H+-transporting ATPase subunit b
MDELRERWRTEVEREQAGFLHDVRRHVAEQFETLARRALADLASAELEAQMARVLLGRLGDLDAERRDVLVQAGASGEPLRVRSAFELPAAVKRSLTSGLHDALGREVEVKYELAGDVVCGIEIRGGGQCLAWSLEAHLDGLERGLADGLRERTAGGKEEARR